MTKQLLKEKVNEINSMSEDELQKFGIDVDMSYIDYKSKWCLYDAIDRRSLELRGLKDTQGSSVVCGELKMGEI